jgi:decaprenylphospho-beta-D-ribofuranose 2-oxidase
MYNEITRRSHSSRLKPSHKVNLKIPYPFKFGVINQVSIRIFNSIWYHKPLGKRIQHVQNYMHPLDGIRNWKTVYGDGGFIQYQFVIPFDRVDTLRKILYKLQTGNCGSILTVLKSFGQNSNGLIGFPMNGWTLAIDLPKKKQNLVQVLRDLDQIVLGAGGRIYLTKDSRMNHSHLSLMYPSLNEWKRIKKEIDPENQWQSDQGRRLKLC